MQSTNTNRCSHRTKQRIGQANCKCSEPNQPVYKCNLLNIVCMNSTFEVISIEVDGEIIDKKETVVCEKCIYNNKPKVT